jgi:YidC/Oxa1 family membrane protein insertase
MPVMFLFLFWNMPSGLVLYWTVQNILSIGEQWFINRKFDAQLAAAN